MGFHIKKSINLFLILLLSGFVLKAGLAESGTLFKDTFDQHPNWQPQTKLESCFDTSCAHPPPDNWSYYRVDELWHPSDNPTKHPTIQVSEENFKGTSGKAFTVWNESHAGSSGDGWGADGILAKDLGNDHEEIYVEVYLKFQDNFQLYFTESNNAMIKMVRFYHWDRAGSPFLNFTNGNNAPIYVFDTVSNPWGFRHSHAFRCDPQESDYFCPGNYSTDKRYIGEPTFDQKLGDGQWHKMSWHAKLNSGPGESDGILEFSVDGVLEFSLYDVAWMGTNSPGDVGWNTVAIGGNAFNTYSDPENQAEQWYALDDLTISTTPIVALGDLDGDSDVDLIDLILGLKVVTGLTPTEISNTGGDANSDTSIGLAEAIYILQDIAGMH